MAKYEARHIVKASINLEAVSVGDPTVRFRYAKLAIMGATLEPLKGNRALPAGKRRYLLHVPGQPNALVVHLKRFYK